MCIYVHSSTYTHIDMHTCVLTCHFRDYLAFVPDE